jgi:hypothetical protein
MPGSTRSGISSLTNRQESQRADKGRDPERRSGSYVQGRLCQDVVATLDVPDLPSVITQIMSTIPQLIEEVSGVTDVHERGDWKAPAADSYRDVDAP